MPSHGIGIISFAHGHVNAYCHQIRTFDDAHLVASWDDDTTRGKQQAEAFGMEFVESAEALVARDDIDAVIIAIETNRHAEMVRLAANAGKHILLQKPMALSLTDCDQIIDDVDRTGVKFSMGYQMRQDPMNRKIRELVQNGTLGKVGVIRRRHCIPVLFHESFHTSWHIDPVKNMGMWMDDASHAADFLLWVMGSPVSVMAEIDNILTNVAPDDTGCAIYRYPNGAMSILLNSSVTWAGENTTEVYGEKGVLIQNHDDSPSMMIKGIPHPIGLKMYLHAEAEKGWQDLGFTLPEGHGARIAAVARPFIDYLNDPSKPHATAREGKACIEMILGAYQSAREGRRIKLPLS
ncbi:MAG: Gfo/Idh/MocA family oxidoreductase [Candidatus Poribacteria bacterium]|nr:Gfo/Idh/MocA family oxidoreductase [Candidatus Poribacteria bacterium]